MQRILKAYLGLRKGGTSLVNKCVEVSKIVGKHFDLGSGKLLDNTQKKNTLFWTLFSSLGIAYAYCWENKCIIINYTDL